MFFEKWAFDEWSSVTTILLSVVAIIIAIDHRCSRQERDHQPVRRDLGLEPGTYLLLPLYLLGYGGRADPGGRGRRGH